MLAFRLLLFALLCILPLDLIAQSTVQINEFMASNVNTINDPDFGETGDWIELYNPTATPIDLTGYGLTDDLTDASKWVIPAGTSIPANGYLLIWADDANSGLHTNFKLSSSGEAVGLFAPDGTPVDAVIYETQQTDVSFGRLSDGQDVWRYLNNPTPGSANQGPGFIGIAVPPEFSQSGGFYDGAQTIVLSSSATQGTIHYTLDGATPTEASAIYSGPISITQTTVVRAVVLQQNYVPGPVITHTFFIREASALPVVSISTDPDHLWSDEKGMYVIGTNGVEGFCADGPRNWNQGWEYPANFELYETDQSMVLNQGVGIEIFGGCSRLFDQKSLAVHARNRYGDGSLSHQIFPEKNIDSFESIILRNSGQDWFRTMYRDAMIQTVIRQGMDVDYQAYRPAVLFLNGAYWGIHNIREKMNEAYIENNHGYERGEFDFLEGPAIPSHGSADHYNNLLNFASSQDMTQASNLMLVDTWMDVDQYLDYQAAEIFIANADWPLGNIRFWRPNTNTGRWRWMVYDTDLSFGGHGSGRNYSNTLAQATDPNGPEWPNPPSSTLLFRSLLENQEFEDRFVQRLASHINTTFDSTRVLFVIDSLKANIADEVPRHEAKWPESIGFNTPWDIHIDRLRDFARLRAANVYQHTIDHFNLTGTANLRIENNQGSYGSIRVATVPISAEVFEGRYFMDVPLAIEAVPLPGYRFAGWGGAVDGSDPDIKIVLTGDTNLTAQFELDDGSTASDDEQLVYQYTLDQNYPNPFAYSTILPYELAAAGQTSIRLIDMTGREVQRLLNTHQPAGRYQITISGIGLASGLYILELRSGTTVMRKSISIVK